MIPDIFNQANELLAVGKRSEAALLIEPALLVIDGTPTEDLALIVGDLERLANLYAHYKCPSEAEIVFKRLLDIYDRERAVPSEMARMLHAVGCLYLDRGRMADAKALFAKAVEVGKTGGDRADVSTFFASWNLAAALRDEGHPDKALQLVETELDIDSVLDKGGDFFVPEMLAFIGDLFARLNRMQEAERTLIRAHELWAKQATPHTDDFVRSLRNLATLYERQGRLEEASELTTRAALLEERGHHA